MEFILHYRTHLAKPLISWSNRDCIPPCFDSKFVTREPPSCYYHPNFIIHKWLVKRVVVFQVGYFFIQWNFGAEQQLPPSIRKQRSIRFSRAPDLTHLENRLACDDDYWSGKVFKLSVFFTAGSLRSMEEKALSDSCIIWKRLESWNYSLPKLRRFRTYTLFAKVKNFFRT